jgi:vacuolar-type H+-ATPase subunit E/Vma4
MPAALQIVMEAEKEAAKIAKILDEAKAQAERVKREAEGRAQSAFTEAYE